MERKTVALIYDYDGTLAFGNIQEPKLLPFLLNENEKIIDFWIQSNKSIEFDNSALAYCNTILKRAKEKNIKLTKQFLFDCGCATKLYPGVEKWFERINQFAKDLNIELHHFIISSGNKELLIGSPVAKYFKEIYGCEFIFENDEAIACHKYIHDPNKKDYLALINEMGIQYKNMLYFGDGLSDLGAMTYVTEMGGYTIGIYEKKLDTIKKLESRGILKFSFNALQCYRKKSKMESTVHEIILEMISEQISLFEE